MSCYNSLYDMDFLCRVCLSGSEKNICLDKALNEERKDSPSILQALEKITTEQILDGRFPSVICPTCVNSVNICFELIEQFEDTQTMLKSYFSKSNTNNLLIRKTKKFKNYAKTICSSDYIASQKSTSVISEDENIDYVEFVESSEYLIPESEEKGDCQMHSEDLEYTDSNENINNSNISIDFQVADLKLKIAGSDNYRKETKTKYVDVDKFIIEKPGFVDCDVTHLSQDVLKSQSGLQYTCTGCSKTYASLQNLEKHEENCIKLKPSISHVGKNKIDEDFKLESLSELDQELFKSALLLKYECDRCSKIYSSVEKLNKHQSVCRKTKKQFKYKAKFSQRVQINSNKIESDLLADIDNSKIDLVEPINLGNLSQIEKDIFRSALKLQHKCPYCQNFFSSEVRYATHLKNCKTRKKKLHTNSYYKSRVTYTHI